MCSVPAHSLPFNRIDSKKKAIDGRNTTQITIHDTLIYSSIDEKKKKKMYRLSQQEHIQVSFDVVAWKSHDTPASLRVVATWVKNYKIHNKYSWHDCIFLGLLGLNFNMQRVFLARNINFVKNVF